LSPTQQLTTLSQVILEDDEIKSKIDSTILKIDIWLDTMRLNSGYGGPVAHWWNDCLNYAGVGLDWRYEGIIGGYLNLFERTGQSSWLDKAQQAGDDLVAGQLPNGNYQVSSFEINPKPGGTPHEAACDLALIKLAQTMRVHHISGWERYIETVEKNIQSYIIGQLWVPESKYFRNLINDPVFVPNKAATSLEAFLAWSEFSARNGWLDEYIIPTLDHILSCQVRHPGKLLDGAIYQSKGDLQRQDWYFPLYNARCIPALIHGYQYTGEEKYRSAAEGAMNFIQRTQYDDGSFPQVIQSDNRILRYPQWIAGVGDILRAMTFLDPEKVEGSFLFALDWLLDGVLPSGGVRTALGFARKSSFKPRRFGLPDFRDLLAVVGWVDKAFHFLTSFASIEFRSSEVLPQPFERLCQYQMRKYTYFEDQQRIELRTNGGIHYRWLKGSPEVEIGIL